MEELLDPPKQVLIGPQALEGELALPPRAQALIVFAHGSGSGRRSPRNLQVAHALNRIVFGGIRNRRIQRVIGINKALNVFLDYVQIRLNGDLRWRCRHLVQLQRDSGNDIDHLIGRRNNIHAINLHVGIQRSLTYKTCAVRGVCEAEGCKPRVCRIVKTKTRCYASRRGSNNQPLVRAVA